MPPSAPAASPSSWSTSCWPPTRRGARPGSAYDDAAGRAEGPRPAGREGVRRREGRAAGARQGARAGCQSRGRGAERVGRAGGRRCCARSPTSSSRGARRRRGRLRRARARRARRATSPPRASSRATTSSSASCSARSTPSAGRKVSGARFYYLTGVGAQLQLGDAADRDPDGRGHGFAPMITPVLVKPEAMEGTGFLGPGGRERLPPRGRRPVPRRAPPRCRSRRTTWTRSSTRGRAPAALRRVVVLLPPRGRVLRQGHPGDHPGAPVRQGRDVLLLPARRRRRRAPAAARVGEGDARPRSRSPTG